VVPQPLIQVLFERGHFGLHDTRMVAVALQAFAFGLPAFVLTKVFQPGFFAREDTKTPMRYAVFSMVLNILISLVLFPFLGHVGIAIATTLAGWINAGLLWATLRKRGHFALDAGARRTIPRLFLASLVMGGALYAALPHLAPWLARTQPFLPQAGALAVLVLAGILIYFLVAALIGAFDLRALLRRLAGRREAG